MDAKIVRLEITDNDGEFNRETIACYYLVNPDMDKLKAIRTMIESRFDDLDAEPTFGCIDEIEELLKANFALVSITTEEIEW